MTLIWHAARAAVAFAVLGSAGEVDAAVPSERQTFCFSDVCLLAGPGDVIPLPLTDLNRIRATGRERPPAADLAGVFPRLSEEDRNSLLSHRDAGGRLLLDASTLPILSRIDQVCASGPPFMALFTSESGHLTSIRLEAVADGDAFRLGVTELARSFKVKPNSPEDSALLADLSRRYGFRVDEAASAKHSVGTSATFERGEDGFRLSFASTVGSPSAVEPQAGCPPASRIKID